MQYSASGEEKKGRKNVPARTAIELHYPSTPYQVISKSAAGHTTGPMHKSTPPEMLRASLHLWGMRGRQDKGGVGLYLVLPLALPNPIKAVPALFITDLKSHTPVSEETRKRNE